MVSLPHLICLHPYFQFASDQWLSGVLPRTAKLITSDHAPIEAALRHQCIWGHSHHTCEACPHLVIQNQKTSSVVFSSVASHALKDQFKTKSLPLLLVHAPALTGGTFSSPNKPDCFILCSCFQGEMKHQNICYPNTDHRRSNVQSYLL